MTRARPLRLSGRLRSSAALVAASLAVGCGTPPPASTFPTARAALDRMHASGACGGGVQAQAKIDVFGDRGRVRGDLYLFAARPARLRMDAVSPFGVNLATLTSDGQRFSLYDVREKRFFTGAPKACNIARFTQVPIPGFVLVELLQGRAPVLVHDASAATVAWSGKGYYVLTLPGANRTEETVHLAVHPDDLAKPWAEQRVRVALVEVRMQGVVLYRAELEDHSPGAMAEARVDPDGIDPPIAPSGPVCRADLPRSLHVEVPAGGEDILFRYDKVTWNPPLETTTFTQPVPQGMRVEALVCDD